jgi:ribose/xylose/arabinose/galactoside ABC-type transport system permease subunit
MGQGSLNALANNQFTGLTAAILGGVSFGGGTGNMAGVFVGLLVLNTFDKGTTIVRFSSYWTTAFTGLLLLIALTMDYLNTRRAGKSVGLIKPAKRGKRNPAHSA